MDYLGVCAHCRCAIWYNPETEKRKFTTDDPDCHCVLQEDLDVVAAIEKGLKDNRSDEEKYYPNLTEDDYRKER